MSYEGSANREAALRMRRHHEAMVSCLRQRLEALVEAVRGQGSWQPTREDFLAYVRQEILPHARAEEETLYAKAREYPELSALVAALVDEHHEMDDRTRKLEVSEDPFESVSIAGAVESLFAVHVDHENWHILDALCRDPGVDLPGIFGTMEKIFSSLKASVSGQDPPPAKAEAVLDVRVIPHGQRHPLIVGLVERMQPGQRLVLVVDHDPLALRRELAGRYGDCLLWTYRAQGPQEWQVEVGLRAIAAP